MLPNEAEVEAVARRRVHARMGFVMHLLTYLAVNVGLFIVWAVTGGSHPWFIWPMLGWGVGIVLHAAALLFGPDSVTERRAIEREIRRLRGGLPTDAPPYRG